MDAARVGDFSTLHPSELPRAAVPLVAHPWAGARCDSLSAAYEELLLRGVAVLDSPGAMFRTGSTESR